MQALSKVTEKTPISFSVDLEINEIETTTTKKISKLMLELFAELMPILQKLGSSAREFGAYNRSHFLNSSSTEAAQRQNLGWISLLGTVAAAPISEGQLHALTAVSGSGRSFVESLLSTTSTNKEIEKELLSKADQDRSTLENFADKLLSLVQQIIQSEKLNG